MAVVAAFLLGWGQFTPLFCLLYFLHLLEAEQTHYAEYYATCLL